MPYMAAVKISIFHLNKFLEPIPLLGSVKKFYSSKNRKQESYGKAKSELGKTKFSRYAPAGAYVSPHHTVTFT
jgi:hypothetical protein